MSTPEQDSNRALQLISEILDKMIDTQTASTEALTNQKAALDSLLKAVLHNTELLEQINKHFANGFRSEIKQHIDTKCGEINVLLEKLIEQDTKLNDLLSKPSYWIKLILATVAATAGAIGGLVALIYKLLNPGTP